MNIPDYLNPMLSAEAFLALWVLAGVACAIAFFRSWDDMQSKGIMDDMGNGFMFFAIIMCWPLGLPLWFLGVVARAARNRWRRP